MEKRPRLVDPSLVQEFAEIAYSESHGAFGDHLGAGQLYYALAMMLRCRVCVCIGSGGGFVPRLMLQAQQDLGFADAQTYLVDANLPDLAFGSPGGPGGWLMPENPLQGVQSGLTILRMLSTDAAKLLAGHGIAIDYLHVDGDHSKRGVLADLEDYLPLLSGVSVVTFHDLRMPGVAQALDQFVARHQSIERLSFAELGNGTGVLRKRPPPDSPALRLGAIAVEQPDRRTLLPAESIAEFAAASEHKSRYERWHYLDTPAYRLRYELIRGLVDAPGATIIEIGGYPNSVVGVLERARRVIAIEPYLPPDFAAQVRAHAAANQIELVLSPGSVGSLNIDPAMLAPYTLVALGLDLSPPCKSAEDFVRALSSLVQLAAGAELIALEVPGFEPSHVTFQALSECLEPTILHDITVDLTRDPVADEYFVKDARGQRRLVVFTPGRAIPQPARQIVIQQAATRLAALKRASEQPQTRDYAFGEEIQFRSGTDAIRYLAGGWAGLEKNFVWGIGPRSRILFKVSGIPPDATIVQLHAVFRPAVVPQLRAAQSLTIAVNGREIFDQSLERTQSVAIPLPRDLFPEDALSEIILVHPDGFRPMDLVPGSHDNRLVSVALCSLQLTVPGDPASSPSA